MTTERSTPRSTGADSVGLRLRRTIPEFTGWGLIAIGALLAIVATGAGSGAGGAAALLAAGVALLVVARADGLIGRLGGLAAAWGIAPAPARSAEGAGGVPHHRAARALLGETVKALNDADASAPWTIERDGAWSTAAVFDYAIYRRHQGAPPERIGIEVDTGSDADVAATALRIASSFSTGGGLYDAILVVAPRFEDGGADRLERLVSRLCGAPCVAVPTPGLTGPADSPEGHAEILRLAEALEHVTSANRASAPRGGSTPAAGPARSGAVLPTPPAPPADAGPSAAPAWSTPVPEQRTAVLSTAPAASDDFAALLAQAGSADPAPSRRSRSQR